MTTNKSQCICAQKGIMCKRKLNLIKQGRSIEEVTSKDFVCPLKAALAHAS